VNFLGAAVVVDGAPDFAWGGVDFDPVCAGISAMNDRDKLLMARPATAGFNKRDIDTFILPSKPQPRIGATARMLTEEAKCGYTVSSRPNAAPG